jgi:hypothetical protein
MVSAVTVSAALVMVFAACGGVGGTDDLFSLTGNGGAGTGGAGATTGPGTTATGTMVSSSSGAATTSGSVASSSAAGGSVASSTSASSTSVSSSSGGPPVQVACNGGPCQPGQICCFNPTGPGDHCAAPGTCMDGWAQFDCNGPEDCPGGSCCATVDVNLQVPYLAMACQQSCDPSSQVVVCSQQQQDVCPQGTQCKTDQSLGNGYRICWPG